MIHEQRTAFVVVSILWLLILAFAVGPLLVRAGMVRPNFRGDRIPVGYGILVMLWCGPALASLAILFAASRRDYAAYLAIALGMGLLGFIDDRWGDRARTGLKGHIRAFFIEGVVTTGFVKAVGGVALALVVPGVILQRSWPDVFIDGAIIALTANALNLLDLRPGRAGAAFLLLATVFITRQWSWTAIPPLIFILIPAVVVYERDARARVMMGDTGSNLLGGTLGLAAAVALPAIAPRLAILGILVVLHAVAERISITQVIDRIPLLKRLDRFTGVR